MQMQRTAGRRAATPSLARAVLNPSSRGIWTVPAGSKPLSWRRCWAHLGLLLHDLGRLGIWGGSLAGGPVEQRGGGCCLAPGPPGSPPAVPEFLSHCSHT